MAKKVNSISVFAPATVGNLACGFDSMGLALDLPGDKVHLIKNNTGKLIIKEVKGDGGRLSKNVNKNTVTVSIKAFQKAFNIQQGFDIYLEKQMPLGSGLGSSAASSVAGVYAAYILSGLKLQRRDLIPFAMEGERVACGSAHADNVAPCMLGGITLVRTNHPLEVLSLPSPEQLYITVVHPHIEVLTKDARAVLKREVALTTAVQQWSNTGALVAGLFTDNYTLIGNSTVDLIAEPYRAALIPGFHEVKKAALNQGALACSISGSGPSLFAFCKGNSIAKKVSAAMSVAFQNKNIASDIYISKVNTTGVTIIK